MSVRIVLAGALISSLLALGCRCLPRQPEGGGGGNAPDTVAATTPCTVCNGTGRIAKHAVPASVSYGAWLTPEGETERHYAFHSEEATLCNIALGDIRQSVPGLAPRCRACLVQHAHLDARRLGDKDTRPDQPTSPPQAQARALEGDYRLFDQQRGPRGRLGDKDTHPDQPTKPGN